MEGPDASFGYGFEEVEGDTVVALAEIIGQSERGVLVTLPATVRKADYKRFYDQVERLAKALDADAGLVGFWPVGGNDE